MNTFLTLATACGLAAISCSPAAAQIPKPAPLVDADAGLTSADLDRVRGLLSAREQLEAVNEHDIAQQLSARIAVELRNLAEREGRAAKLEMSILAPEAQSQILMSVVIAELENRDAADRLYEALQAGHPVNVRQTPHGWDRFSLAMLGDVASAQQFLQRLHDELQLPEMTVLSRPQVRALAGHSSYLQVGQAIPVVTGVTVLGDGIVRPELAETPTGLTLSFTSSPREDEQLGVWLELTNTIKSGQGVPVFSDPSRSIRIESPILDVTKFSAEAAIPKDHTLLLISQPLDQKNGKPILLLLSPRMVENGA